MNSVAVDEYLSNLIPWIQENGYQLKMYLGRFINMVHFYRMLVLIT